LPIGEPEKSDASVCLLGFGDQFPPHEGVDGGWPYCIDCIGGRATDDAGGLYHDGVADVDGVGALPRSFAGVIFRP
jgi:hypothetical protein